MEPSATLCPICLRPRGKLEITRAYATLRMMEKKRRQRPFVIAGFLLAAAAAFWALSTFHGPIAAASLSAHARMERFFDMTMSANDPAANRAVAAPPQAAQTASAPPPPVDAQSPAAPVPASIAPARASPANAARSPGQAEDLRPPAFDTSSQWAFYGRVYDLITLLPVADVQLAFTAVGMGMSAGARSDSQGRFLVVLQRLAHGSYEIHGSHSGYASLALYESDIPYARLTLTDRREIAHSAQDGDLTLPPLSDVPGEDSVRRDVFLAPSR